MPLHRPLISCAIAYFILPADVIPEEVYGPSGFVDDIWLCAWTLNVVRKETENDDLLTKNWNGEAPLLPLLADILRQEQNLIGEQGAKILAYTGCDRVVGM